LDGFTALPKQKPLHVPAGNDTGYTLKYRYYNPHQAFTDLAFYDILQLVAVSPILRNSESLLEVELSVKDTKARMIAPFALSNPVYRWLAALES
jgi:hypothetical protein